MSQVTEDRLLDCMLNEVLTAVGCATFAAVPGAWFAYVNGLSGAVGALLAGLLTYAVFTAWDHFGRTRRDIALRSKLAELEDKLARLDGSAVEIEPEAIPVQVRLSRHGSERYATSMPVARARALV